jgi:hypothetical protein
MTSLRAALLVVGATLGGVALSLILGSSPAHAADGDGSGSGTEQGQFGSATSIVATTVRSTLDRTIATAQRTVRTAGASTIAALPAAEPLVTPVIVTVASTLTVVHQLVRPAVDSVLPLGQHFVATPNRAPAPFASVQMVPGAPSGKVAGALPAVQRSGSDGALPSPILTSSTGGPVAALGVLLALFALVLLAARQRLDGDALPASPTFETDTSPA